MAISTRDGLISALAAGTVGYFNKASSTTVVGRPWCLFRNTGNPVGGATPSSTGAALDRTTSGAIAIPAASNTTYLVGVSVAAANAQAFLVYDRLVETGGLSGTTTTAQTVNSASLPARNTTGAGTELWLEVYTTLGPTGGVNPTASYTNQAGTASRTATMVGSLFTSMAANTTQQFALQSGDTGVRSVQSVTLGGSTGVAGNFGITIRQPVYYVAAEGGAGTTSGYPVFALATVPDNACLEVIVIPQTASLGVVYGNIRVAQG